MNGEACIPNIGLQERMKRLRFGLGAWGMAVAGFVVLVLTDVADVWRLALFLPLWAGGQGFFQHREKT